MKLAVLITGGLRNWRRPFANYRWPAGVEIDYHLVTWNKIVPIRCEAGEPQEWFLTPVWDEVNALLDPTFHTYDYDLFTADNTDDQINTKRMLFLWEQAAKVATRCTADTFLIVRPDCALLTNMEPQWEAIDPQGGINAPFIWANEKPTNLNDCFFSFAAGAADAVQQWARRSRDLCYAETLNHEEWDPHAKLAQTLADVDVPLCNAIGDAYLPLIVRRNTVAEKWTPETLGDELAYCKWHWENVVKGSTWWTPVQMDKVVFDSVGSG